MQKPAGRTARKDRSLSREVIVEASIEILDENGESGLTFRALSERLSTGAGAIYWHVENKSELVVAACDSVVAAAIDALPRDAEPKVDIRALGVAVFDMIEAHEWIGSAIAYAPWQSSMVRILERLGQNVRKLGVAESELRICVSTLVTYIFGVAGIHSANAQFARVRGIERADFLETVGVAWSALDRKEYPFTHSIIEDMRDHDDRADFAAGLDVILRGIVASKPPKRELRLKK